MNVVFLSHKALLVFGWCRVVGACGTEDNVQDIVVFLFTLVPKIHNVALILRILFVLLLVAGGGAAAGGTAAAWCGGNEHCMI